MMTLYILELLLKIKNQVQVEFIVYKFIEIYNCFLKVNQKPRKRHLQNDEKHPARKNQVNLNHRRKNPANRNHRRKSQVHRNPKA